MSQVGTSDVAFLPPYMGQLARLRLRAMDGVTTIVVTGPAGYAAESRAVGAYGAVPGLTPTSTVTQPTLPSGPLALIR